MIKPMIHRSVIRDIDDVARHRARPFTITSHPEWQDLDLIIRIYPDHNDVTEQLAPLNRADNRLISIPRNLRRTRASSDTATFEIHQD